MSGVIARVKRGLPPTPVNHGFILENFQMFLIKILLASFFHIKQTPWPLVRKRTIPTERPPLVGEM
jgi:hypothetical protein